MAYENWGLALFNLGKLISDPSFLKESIDKFDRAESINPKIESIYSSWSAALSNYAKMDTSLSSSEVTKYYETARDKARIAYIIGGSAYNLACSYALLGDKDNALKYLKESVR